MLNLNRLRVLCEVIDRGSLSAAAGELNYTQSAVSQQVAALEAEVGMTLLERHSRGVRPTAAGAALADHAAAIFASVRTAEDQLAEIAGLRAGHLRLASFPSAGSALLPAAIARFGAAHPGIAMSLIEGEPEQIAPRMLAGEIDLALLFEFHDIDVADQFAGSEVRRVRLCEDPMEVALPAGHRLAGAQQVAIEQLGAEHWVQVSRQSACARYVLRACRAAGFEPKVAFESDDYATLRGLVAAGVGVALVPRMALGAEPGGLAVRPLRDPAARTITAALAAGPEACPAAHAMLAVLQSLLAPAAASRA